MTEHDKAWHGDVDGASTFLCELDEGWWHPEVRPAVSRAAYAEIARAAGNCWAPGDIERAIAKINGVNAKAEGLSNKFRKTWKDQTVPSPQTLSEVRRAFPDCQAQLWSKHPIFFLLDGRSGESSSSARAAVSYAFDSLRGPIRAELWKQDIDDEPWTGRLLRALDDRAMLNVLHSEAFEQLAPIDRLMLSTALAKMALAEESRDAYHQAVWITSATFDRAVATSIPLLVGWPWLLDLYERQLWQPHNANCSPPDRISTNHKKGLADAVLIAMHYGQAMPPDEMFEWSRLKTTASPSDS
jgi:hypothetical protein